MTISDLQQQLQQTFGYRQFRCGQERVLAAWLAGQDSVVLMPTGGGKSLCYQLPALAQRGLVLVVSPLISLMEDQVNQCCAVGIRAAMVHSAMTGEEMLAVYRACHEGQLQMLYVSPERILQGGFIERMANLQIALIAIDEAHCVSHWGHDFRQDYRHLHRLKSVYPHIPMMALSATADTTTQSDIIQQLGLQSPFIYRGSFDRPNIRYEVIAKHKPMLQLNQLLRKLDGPGIIYCNSRKKVDEVHRKLYQDGWPVERYHAGMEAADRRYAQSQFQKDKRSLMVATVAFGMGINKSNIRYVIHYDLPRSIEGYYQETGRAGRDGLPAEAILLFDEKDKERIYHWIETSDSSRAAVERDKFAAMHLFAEAQTCRRVILLNYFSEATQTACGNCDICLNPPTTFTATVEAQKILSTVLRAQQRITATQVVDALLGRKLARKDLNAAELSTFGLGKGKGAAYWQDLIQQLIHLGFLRIAITEHGYLKITAAAAASLKAKHDFTLAVPRLAMVKQVGSRQQPANYDKALLQRLKALRAELAEAQDVPPYVIFSDLSLTEMASRQPRDELQFLAISGVGQVKLERYGSAFLQAIAQYQNH